MPVGTGEGGLLTVPMLLTDSHPKSKKVGALWTCSEQLFLLQMAAFLAALLYMLNWLTSCVVAQDPSNDSDH